MFVANANSLESGAFRVHTRMAPTEFEERIALSTRILRCPVSSRFATRRTPDPLEGR